MYGGTKGLYVQSIIDQLKKDGDPVEVERMARDVGFPASVAALQEYPVRDITFLMEECFKRFQPAVPQDDLMVRYGERGFAAFSESLLGRVGLAFFARDLRKFGTRIPNYFKAANAFGKVTHVELGRCAFRIEFREMLTNPHYNFGLGRAACRHIAPDAQLELKVLRFENKGRGELSTDFDVTVSWEG